ncbi:hypothetical protein FB45DRAFT_844551 [Roridomyces roridus]|uniref:UBA domain-containing protein n=1 Tax=Roridomyces roridus TaxID=1738132 RepID=A0AAD7B559_9AGAR|nr:hypothetical protein FB45DRAFT_844551 [Roridomyces roridus]
MVQMPGDSEREPLEPQEAQQWVSDLERRDAETLRDLVANGVTLEVALKVLRKHNNDLPKAADALLSGRENEDEDATLASFKETYSHLFPGSTSGGDGSGNPVIDLTGDDEPQHTQRFRATTRSPDPKWQMVRTDVKMDDRDDELNKAMQTSYETFTAESDAIPNEEMKDREGDCPMAIRSDKPERAYAALVLHALFHVPQVRHRLAQFHLTHVDEGIPRDRREWAIFNLLELYATLDYGTLSFVIEEQTLLSWSAPPLTRVDSANVLSKMFLDTVVNELQLELESQAGEPNASSQPLFRFTHCEVYQPPTGPPVTRGSDSSHNVSISVDGPGAPSLIARLTHTLNTYKDDGSSSHSLIMQPSTVFTFEISPAYSVSGGAEQLVYPKTIFLDEFLLENLDLANERRLERREVQKEIELLVERKAALTRFEGMNTFEEMRGAIEYYESIADGREDAARAAMLDRMAGKLKEKLTKLEKEVEESDRKLVELQAELDAVVENKELQNHPYDLRAVLIHTGLPGRRGIYSYVRRGTSWWKTMDYMVSEVPEDLVLTDPAGVHFGAGPYLLIYSRRVSEEEERAVGAWPPLLINDVKVSEARLRQAEVEAEGEKAVRAESEGERGRSQRADEEDRGRRKSR